MSAPVLVSIQVGLPTEYGQEDAADPFDRCWRTGFFKQPVSGPVAVAQTNLAGDCQADLENHGGPDKAACVYSLDHYEAWRNELGLDIHAGGSFGENLSVANLTESDVCIGDVWKIGSALFQLSQPRQPCWKLARRWKVKDLALRVQQSGRTGWYFRVLSEGTIEAGQELILCERPCPEWSVARANQIMHTDQEDLDAAAALAELPLLSKSWRKTLRKRVLRTAPTDVSLRLDGPNRESPQA